MNLTPELQAHAERIKELAKSYGLDGFETVFEMLSYDELNEVASYGGFPVRYPHWRHGMEYERISRGYEYGLHKIYELVINNDPCYAYLLSSNSEVENKLVMAHVYGHCDFFKNNRWFSKTNRKMIDRMANHATMVRRLVDRHGQDCVEEFLDLALSLDNLVDLHAELSPKAPSYAKEGDGQEQAVTNVKLRSRDYMDSFMNPPGELERRRRHVEEEKARERKLPGGPRRDVLSFLLEHAPLERFEWELLNIVREEAIYFAPQRMTKIMNEGWASYWHRLLMVNHVLCDDEIVDYADTCAATLSEGASLNPYKLGLELFLDIEERFNTGRHGADFDACDDMATKRAWDTKAMEGRRQIFLCRAVHNDVTFLDEYLTEEFCHRHKLFVYRFDRESGKRQIVTRDFVAVKEQLLRQLANGGAPVLEVVDLNYGNRSELHLAHRHDGQELRTDWADACLKNLARLWKRPVHLDTIRGGEQVRLSSDGSGVGKQPVR